jgi:hypothetical protein
MVLLTVRGSEGSVLLLPTIKPTPARPSNIIVHVEGKGVAVRLTLSRPMYDGLAEKPVKLTVVGPLA